MDILTEHAQPSSCPQPPHKKMKHFVLYILLLADQVSGFFAVDVHIGGYLQAPFLLNSGDSI